MEYALFLRQHIEAVVPLTNEEFETVLYYFTPQSVPKKTLLIRSGQVVQHEYFVVSGCMKSFVPDESDKDHILQFATEGWWVSDYPAYAREGKGQVHILALEDCFILSLKRSDKKLLSESVPKMHAFWGSKSFSGYVALQLRVLSLLKNSAKEKYDLLLEQYPQLFQRVSKTLIAQYLGVSRETLSRLHK